MNNTDLSRYSKRLVQYFWDPMPTNTDSAPIWCLGQQYPSDPGTSHTDSGNRTHETSDIRRRSSVETAEDEALQKHWPAGFVDDIESRIWLTYRSDFDPIARSPQEPGQASGLSALTRLRQLGNTSGGFTSDTGWGCMIRSGQSLLANTLAILKLGRDWRTGQSTDEEKQILSLFADDPSAPFSLHRFVKHGAAACGKHPGEWFGPSATARCIQALTSSLSPPSLRVYVRPDDSDIYEDAFLNIARDANPEGQFHPTLILLGTRLGIDRITPVYWRALCSALEMPQSIGIAGGRPSSSHYFVGTQGEQLFYLDPHSTRPKLPLNPGPEDIATCHTRRLRRIGVSEMDPSMLIGFLIRDEQDWSDWKTRIQRPGNMAGDGQSKAKPIVHVHAGPESGDAVRRQDGSSGERASALDEVLSCDDDSGDEAAL